MGRKRRKLSHRSGFALPGHVGSPAALIDHCENSARCPVVLSSPHLQQSRGASLSFLPEHSVPRTLPHGAAPRLPYRRREQEPKSTVHWGQRKLLVSEIEFLTAFAGPADDAASVCCVYLGAAPGTHIPCLSQLFPTVEFILVDPSAFCIGDTDRISIRNEFATPERCSALRGRADVVLCICDIRTADWRVMDSATVEAAVAADMALQQDCVRALQPQAAMLKFRLPYTGSGSVEYLDGVVHLPVWGPQTTTESRLVVRPSGDGSFPSRQWGVLAYNQEMFYFNTITRGQAYEHDVESAGLDYCYDCAAEVSILKNFLVKRVINRADLERHPHELRKRAAKLVRRVSAACSSSGKRDLVNWSSSNNYEVKLYDASSGSLTVAVLDVAGPEGGAAADSPEAVCTRALRASGGARWHDLDEDALLNERSAERCRFTYGANGFGFDLPRDCSVAMWVRAVVLEMAGLYADALPPSTGTEQDAAMGAQSLLHLSGSVTAWQNALSGLQLCAVERALAPASVCAACAATGGISVGGSRARVLLLISRTGAMYIIWLDYGAVDITKIILPTVSLCHASLLSGYVEIQYYSTQQEETIETHSALNYKCCRQIFIEKMYTMNGAVVAPGDTSEVKKFVAAELNFVSATDLGEVTSRVENPHPFCRGRADVLRHSGLHSVCVPESS